jgi:hypothetical protein
MTNEEAIGFLQSRIDLIDKCYPDVKDYREALITAIEALEQQPRMGEWLKNGELCKCSNCHSLVLLSVVKSYNYCFRCGAKMEVSE